MPRFDKVYCSQCGGEFGPRDSGYSHCEDHAGLPNRDGYSRPIRVDLECDFRGMMARSFDDPDTICREQEIEMRRAFMAGAVTVLSYLDEGPLAEIVEVIGDQLNKHLEDVRCGRA